MGFPRRIGERYRLLSPRPTESILSCPKKCELVSCSLPPTGKRITGLAVRPANAVRDDSNSAKEALSQCQNLRTPCRRAGAQNSGILTIYLDRIWNRLRFCQRSYSIYSRMAVSIIYLSIFLSIYPSIYLCKHHFTHLCKHHFTHPSIYLLTNLSSYPSTYLSINLHLHAYINTYMHTYKCTDKAG